MCWASCCVITLSKCLIWVHRARSSYSHHYFGVVLLQAEQFFNSWKPVAKTSANLDKATQELFCHCWWSYSLGIEPLHYPHHLLLLCSLGFLLKNYLGDGVIMSSLWDVLFHPIVLTVTAFTNVQISNLGNYFTICQEPGKCQMTSPQKPAPSQGK
jgi:hypothetical protein